MMQEEVFGMSGADMDATLRLIGKTPIPSVAIASDDSTRLVIAYTSAGATARSGTTLGYGTCTLRYLADSGTDRVLTATTYTDPVDFYNLSTSAVGATRYIMLLRLGNDYICVWEECT
jgi:hypothetical protein